MNEESRSSNKHDRGGLFDRLRSIFSAPQTSVRDDIEDSLTEASEGELSSQERAMLRSVLGLHELRARDIMVPRSDIVAVESADSIGHVLELFRTAGHSRLPVYAGSLDSPQGMIHIRDFLELLARLSGAPRPDENGEYHGHARFNAFELSSPLPASEFIRPVLFVPPSMPVLELLVRMQSERTHMALVIDEYGGTDGLVSIEDAVEVIVGDIEDEHDSAEAPQIKAVADGFVIDGRAPLDEAIAMTGIDFIFSAEAEDVDTVAGFVATVAGRLPEKGETIRLNENWEFQVLDADRRRIKQVKLRQAAPADPNAGSAPGI